MVTDLLLVFKSTFFSILQVFLVMLAAGLLVRAKLVTQEHIRGLSGVAVAVFIPCLIFGDITAHFDRTALSFWWVLPLAAIAMMAFGFILSGTAFARELPAKKNMLSLASIQNAGYLVLPIGQALFSREEFESRFAVYTFLYILGVSPVLWSVGKYLATAGAQEKLSWRGLATAPIIANVAALFFVFTDLRQFVPSPVSKSITLMGQAAVPVATFVLGASLASIHLRLRPYWFDALRALGIKLVLIPLATLLVLRAIPGFRESYGLLGAFLMIEAASAPATTTILQVRAYGGDEQKVGSILFFGYILCAFTLPFWYAVWKVT